MKNIVKNLVFDPFIGLGPLKFGMSELAVNSLVEKFPGAADLSYQNGKLSAYSIYPSDVENIIFFDQNVLKMDKLAAALFFAEHSNDYGQAQGGSLYFMDLGFAILQFESACQEFFFFSSTHDTGEPLRTLSASDIEAYYKDNAYDE